jgi:hypothetical protein
MGHKVISTGAERGKQLCATPAFVVHIAASRHLLVRARAACFAAGVKPDLFARWLFAALAFISVHAVAAPRPNFLLLMADDMGFSDISPYGGEIRTPNLERLAREGMKFTQFYNNAKCTTTRAALLSGMYPRGAGNNIPLNLPTIGEHLRAAGYQTALSGKWHLGSRAPQRPYDRASTSFTG